MGKRYFREVRHDFEPEEFDDDTGLTCRRCKAMGVMESEGQKVQESELWVLETHEHEEGMRICTKCGTLKKHVDFCIQVIRCLRCLDDTWNDPDWNG